MEGSAEITKALEGILDTHGYGFQYAVLATAQRLFSPTTIHGSRWRLPIAEFPVEVNGAHSHIDLILEHCLRPILMVGECKRANPALRNWCFLRAPHREESSLSSSVFIENLTWSPTGDPCCTVQTLFNSENIYHLGIEVKSVEKGNPCDKGRGAIEEAATQVMRCTNGLVEFLKRSDRARQEKKRIQLLPVIFTTARIWVSQANLGDADLLTGKLDLTQFPAEEKPWVFLHYSQSPGLKHSLTTTKTTSNDNFLIDALYADYVRTIGIVTASGIEDFFRIGHWTP
jgi:hypothetical protein